MKRTTRILLVGMFFGFVAAGLVAHVCVICYPDHPYLARVQQAFLAEGGQDGETAPALMAWHQAKRKTGSGAPRHPEGRADWPQRLLFQKALSVSSPAYRGMGRDEGRAYRPYHQSLGLRCQHHLLDLQGPLAD
jgi:hypothetical protein